MGRQHDPTFEPLPQQKAAELQWTINKAERNGEAVVIDPDRGVVGSAPVNLISGNENTTGLVRYGRHFGVASRR